MKEKKHKEECKKVSDHRSKWKTQERKSRHANKERMSSASLPDHRAKMKNKTQEQKLMHASRESQQVSYRRAERKRTKHKN